MSTRPRRSSGPGVGVGRGIALLVVVVWLVVGAVGGPQIGQLSTVQENDNAAFLPKTAESTRAAEQAKKLQPSEALPFFLVVTRDAGLRPGDQVGVRDLLRDLSRAELAPGHPWSDYLAPGEPRLIPDDPQRPDALLVVLNMRADRAADQIGDESPVLLAAQDLRQRAADDLEPSGLSTYVTGPGGITADLVTAFAGIDGLLLLVALGVVLVILLVVYRSPLLPFAVLVSAIFGLALAALVVYPLAKAGHLELSGQSQGIMFILVVGAATDYALLLVSRYREELHRHERPLDAMRVAWRAAVPPIVASALTVVLGLTCLLLSELGNTSGLGPIGALGIAGALIASLTFLPAVLVLVGRRVFWPVIPRHDEITHDDAELSGGGVWVRVARFVGGRPRVVWAVTTIALLGCAAGAPALDVGSVRQSDIFRNTVESVTGQDVLERHFPAGAGAPTTMVVPRDQAQAVATTVRGVHGVESVAVVPGGSGSDLVSVQAVLGDPVDSDAAEQTVTRIRSAVDEVDPDVLVGGQTASALDLVEASKRDLYLIVPAILVVVTLVLALLLRSLVAPVLLVVANVLSFAATLGVAALVFGPVLDTPGVDPQIPLYAYVFLVALGVDYSIFLMTRAREESVRHGTRRGTLLALAVTGSVITSAGVVLAATFSALVVIPLLFLLQVAFLVAFGVLLDTLVVRSLLVPALTVDVGERVWWPGRLAGKHTARS